MKKILSYILCFMIIIAMPISSVSAKASLSKPTVTVTAGVKKATVKIKKVSGAKKYQIFMKKGSESWTKIKTTASLKYTKTSLSGGKTYYFKVRGVDKNGNPGTFSKVKKVKIKAQSVGSVVYITDTGTKYHRSTCSALSKSKHKISLANAKSMGYTPCARCKP